MKYLFVYNPASGDSHINLPVYLAEHFAGEDYAVKITSRRGDAFKFAKKAIDDGYEVVVAVGGDGTVSEVASALRHTNTSLGIIPTGSGNGLARELGLYVSPEKSMEILLKGDTKMIDSGCINGIPFFCTCGIGFDAQVSERFYNEKNRGKLKYLQKMLEEYMIYRPKKIRAKIGDMQIEDEYFMVTIANASQWGNNAYVAPHAQISDGLLDVVLIRPFPPIEVPNFALQIFSKKIEEYPFTSTYQTAEIKIHCDSVEAVHIDGEPIRLGNDLTIQVRPLSLKVIIQE